MSQKPTRAEVREMLSMMGRVGTIKLLRTRGWSYEAAVEMVEVEQWKPLTPAQVAFQD